MAITTIQIDIDVRDHLKMLGHKGETYNEIIERLLDASEYIDFMRENYRILDSEKNWVSLDDM